eukprot:NODE_19721_length_830_cov_5.371266.p1 GENE.NODE_19721_length_830_cov_5.371266~~NODE_19721_length_830_cov_5.371266.p1  ORF type:complete len:174 (+),score=43.54 NODE_19721_length_830_cov_5.371266:111-632(+)
MPVYHSRQSVEGCREACGVALLPLAATRFPGPAVLQRDIEEDIVHEALKCFRWNILFRNFEVQGAADRDLIYLTLWIQKCLATAQQCSRFEEAKRQLEALANSDICGPGDNGFVLAPFFPAAKAPKDKETAMQYLKQLRQETVFRLLPVLYPNGTANKWWFQFSKKRFMNLTL